MIFDLPDITLRIDVMFWTIAGIVLLILIMNRRR